ncbi:MAG: C25 family cysteine peptidase, partial [bacterium]
TGTLIVNYVGHGNSTQWAHEVIFEQGRDFPQMQNGKRLPFFVAATCDFGRFDKLNSQSFPEEMLAARDRGIIGIITSSRVVFASSNARFNEQYYRQLFGTTLNGQTIGEAMMNARLFTSDITNDEKYAIIGDPSMRLGVPTVPANVTNVTPDSLFALSQTRVQGRVGSDTTLVQEGQLELLVFDNAKRTRYTTSRGLSVSYLLPGNLLFRGTGTLSNNRFDMGFIVPKDITYGGQSARISVYGFGDNMEAIGVEEPIPISLRSGILFDDAGPQITVSFDGRENFATGDPVPQQAAIVATIVDSISGINVTAEIGHKITFTIDGETQNQLDLTRNFVYFPNDFRGGQLVTQLPELPLGRHFAELKAWDNSNNSSTAFLEFIVTERDVLSLTEVWNYPNPFSDNTSFTFTLNTEAEVKISIYTIAGRLIKTIENFFAIPGFNQIPWDGLDEDGDALANGVYLYKIIAKSTIADENKSADFIGKIAVRR